jgi:pimeloyl-ACP methyl ester carboxylesterase
MATYVLVHGGGHGGWCYQRVAPLLRAEGHLVHAPSLTGLGDRSHVLHPGIDLDTHVEDVASLMHFEDLDDVILVGHSYGGMVITGVADRAFARIGHLVYLDAVRPRDGEALCDVNELVAGLQATVRVVDGVELVLFPGTDPLGFFGVADPDAIAWMRPRLTPHPWRCFTQPIRLVNESAVEALPRSNINTTPRLARMRSEGRGDREMEADRLWEIDTGHDLMITEPQAVADILLEIAAA